MPQFFQPRTGDRGVASGVEHRLTLQGCGVLIVEDEAMVAMLLEDLLQELGCQGQLKVCDFLYGNLDGSGTYILSKAFIEYLS